MKIWEAIQEIWRVAAHNKTRVDELERRIAALEGAKEKADPQEEPACYCNRWDCDYCSPRII